MAGLAIGCVKVANTSSSQAMIFEMLASSPPYQTFGIVTEIPITAADAEANFSWGFGRPFQWFLGAIKIRNTDTHMVEVHHLTREGVNYQDFWLQKGTQFSLSDAPNFDFMYGEGGNLIGVKRHNCESKFVEVHVLTWDSSYEEFIHHRVTPIPEAEAAAFVFAVTYSDRLVAIKLFGTESQRVELFFLSPDYETFTSHAVTSIDTAAARELEFLFEAFRDGEGPHFNLLGITRGTTPSSKIEVHKWVEPWNGPPAIVQTAFRDLESRHFNYAVMR